MLLARERIARIEQDLRDMAPDIQEALDQSSETWHDNAPFEALRDKRSNLLQEITYIKTVLASSTKVVPRAKPGTVGVGSVVRVRNARTGQVFAAALLDHYRQTLSEIRDTGYLTYAGRQFRPYLRAAAGQFSPKRRTITQRLIEKLPARRRP